MKEAIANLVTTLLIASTLFIAGYFGRFTAAYECGKNNTFQFGNLNYRCQVSGFTN